MDTLATKSTSSLDLLAEDDVIPIMRGWQRDGLRSALVTLIGVEGTAPRPVGAQMAVAEDGRYVGYLSGGCLEQAVALEAKDVIAAGQNRLVRYGRGSPYFDVRLPCGSGIDLYFDCSLDAELLEEMSARIDARASFALSTDLASGISEVRSLKGNDPSRSNREDHEFIRVFHPKPRLLLLGSGPTVPALATLAASVGIDAEIWSPDQFTRARVREAGLSCGAGATLSEETLQRIDFATAIVVIFHEHDVEPPLLAELLRHECFYIGALGSRAVHRLRLDALTELGVSAEVQGRLRAPIGFIQGAKSKATLAIGIFAELMAEAKACNLVA